MRNVAPKEGRKSSSPESMGTAADKTLAADKRYCQEQVLMFRRMAEIIWQVKTFSISCVSSVSQILSNLYTPPAALKPLGYVRQVTFGCMFLTVLSSLGHSSTFDGLMWKRSFRILMPDVNHYFL